MTKKEFLSNLRRRISKLPHTEVKERLGFYSEIIDDKMEEGLSEDAAVAEIGSVVKIASQILADANIVDTAKNKKPISAWQIVLLIVGSPIWLPILLAAFIVIWAVIISIWAVEIPCFIFAIISKGLLIACIAATKFAAKLTKKCFDSVGALFSGKR